MGKWRVFALRAPSSLIWGRGWGGDGGFAVPFYYVQDCSSIAGMLLAQLPVERCNSQQSGFGSLQVEFLSTAWVAALTATISFSFTMFMQLVLNQHLLVPEEAKFVCMKMGIQKFDKLFSIPPPPPQPPCLWRSSKDRHQSNYCGLLRAKAHRIIVGHSFLYAVGTK